MLKVTADSNIYISALHFGGTPEKVLELARNGTIQLAVSSAILSEFSRVLLNKFGWTEELVLQACDQISGFADRIEPSVSIQAVAEDPADNRILECAIAAGSDYLVTGDKHLLRLGQHQSVRIVTAAELLKILVGKPA